MSEFLEKDGERVKGEPHVWVQWKGTNVCCDIHCKCGAHLHFDGWFFYVFQCPHCKRFWEVGTHMPVYEVTAPSDWHTSLMKYPEPDEEYESSEDSR
jgi:hypothetical protein